MSKINNQTNLTTLSIDQLLYFNGVSITLENDNKKVTYAIEINYTEENTNLLTSKVKLVFKHNKKIISIFLFSNLLLSRENKNNYLTEDLNLEIFDRLIQSLEVHNLNRVDQNLYILCNLVNNHIKEDQNKDQIVPINKEDLFNLVIDTGKKLEELNIQHTLEFSRLYRVALRQSNLNK